MDEVSRATALKARLAFVKITVVEGSSLPYRVERKRNGTMDGGPFLTREQAEECILKLDLEKISQKATRKTGGVGPKPGRSSYKEPRYAEYR